MASRVEIFVEFNAALDRARQLARAHNQSVSLKRDGNGWVVELLVGAVSNVLIPDPSEEDYETDSESFSSEVEDEYDREVARPILDEMMEDQDSFARSDEDGWFYED